MLSDRNVGSALFDAAGGNDDRVFPGSNGISYFHPGEVFKKGALPGGNWARRFERLSDGARYNDAESNAGGKADGARS